MEPSSLPILFAPDHRRWRALLGDRRRVVVLLALTRIAARLPLLGGALLAASAGLMCLITGLMVNGYVFY